MGVKDTLDKMPERVKSELEDIRKIRKLERERHISTDVSRERAFGYTKGLRDAGMITERERQMLYIYATV